MSTQQPEALRLANKMSSYSLSSGYAWHCHKAAAELRRLHSVNAELLEALIVARQAAIGWLDNSWGFDPETDEHPDWLIQSDAAITKATGEKS